jgi:hypothetical protein
MKHQHNYHVFGSRQNIIMSPRATSVTEGGTPGGTQKLPKEFKSVETYWHDHSLESSWWTLSDAPISFSGSHFLNFSQNHPQQSLKSSRQIILGMFRCHGALSICGCGHLGPYHSIPINQLFHQMSSLDCFLRITLELSLLPLNSKPQESAEWNPRVAWLASYLALTLYYPWYIIQWSAF